MATWSDLERLDPSIAEAARALLTVPGFGFGNLATVAASGMPRIHPVTPVWPRAR